MATRRWPALDGLRGVAILLVVTAHFGLGVTGGMVGVTLFFVLSGFLITHLLLDENEHTGRIDLKAFYMRRGLRLIPALAVYLVGMSLFLWMLDLGIPVWEIAWPPALYVANYVQVLGVDLVAHRHTWSLAVEEHFYLVWPVLVILGATRRLKLLAWIVVTLVVWRLTRGLSDPVWAYMATDTNAYALGLGCLLAAMRHRGVALQLPPRTAETGVVVLILLSLVPFRDLDHLYQIGVWLPVLAALTSGAAVWAAVGASPVFLSGQLLGWFGGISYALYLWHAPLMQLPAAANPVVRLTALAAAIGIAALSWKLVEGPILRSRLRRRFAPENRLPSLTVAQPLSPGAADHESQSQLDGS